MMHNFKKYIYPVDNRSFITTKISILQKKICKNFLNFSNLWINKKYKK